MMKAMCIFITLIFWLQNAFSQTPVTLKERDITLNEQECMRAVDEQSQIYLRQKAIIDDWLHRARLIQNTNNYLVYTNTLM
ncbi:MAG: hypothetical protein K2X39_01185, partial [Silvanigrellaceae bacterium]|nr:hypothetical protein [Silvanigrellaceae bacterium]